MARAKKADSVRDRCEDACRGFVKVEMKDVECGGPLVRNLGTQDDQGYGMTARCHALGDCQALPFGATHAE
jgi:hypothetical protein